ncbi:uncharacterized protein MICPUCDRAFT_52905 [Micromonas pusilla CCMP1545]|uniref:Predicted protein n=1 Tax=Micromonas pusilla (strain CCMP1545) TaxID=564608 RepID=C1N5D7_MICPC|nr:uncharacterized protein MICPUCDRAFT_52905 [Micromonas pusilla CCMP1545]EEH53091.1 predicted protein [Micromonas pusilla CCMP1545]|eukprot:XP_003063152.1 predicted protein [Micromonas pusilla CCMP1545]
MDRISSALLAAFSSEFTSRGLNGFPGARPPAPRPPQPPPSASCPPPAGRCAPKAANPRHDATNGDAHQRDRDGASDVKSRVVVVDAALAVVVVASARLAAASSRATVASASTPSPRRYRRNARDVVEAEPAAAACRRIARARASDDARDSFDAVCIVQSARPCILLALLLREDGRQFLLVYSSDAAVAIYRGY